MVLGLLLIMSVSVFSQTDIISNGGFENWTVNGAGGPPDAWDLSSSSVTASQEATNVHTGTYAVNLTWTTTSTERFEQIINVTSGLDYQFKFYALDNDPGGRVRVTIRWYDGTGSLISGYYGAYSSDSPDWQLIDSGIQTAPANAVTAHVEIRVYDVSGSWSGSATVYVDDAVFLEYSTQNLTISNVTREVVVPTSSQDLMVNCDVTGGTPPYTVLLKYSVNGVPQPDVTMTNIAGDTYSGTIPAQVDGARVEYYIEASDAAKTTTTSSTYGLFWGTSPISSGTNGIKEVDASGVLKYTDYYARVTGVATVGSGIFTTTSLDVYIQDAFGGIDVFKWGATSPTIIEGNSYTVVGKITQYNGKAEIIPDDADNDITDNGAVGTPSPLIKTIDELLANPEAYEGMLIGIMHLNKDSGSWPSSGSNGTLVMNDGSTNNLNMYIDKDTDLDDNPEPVWPKDVVGIFNQYDTSSPYDEGYQIVPRSYNDIHNDGSLPVSLTSFTAQAGNNQVTLQWITESEVNNVGFEILRATSEDGDYTVISSYENNPALKGHLTSNTRHVYQFTDRLVMNGITYWYKLVDVDLNGRRNVHGPLAVTPNEAGSNITHTGNIPQKYALYPNYPNPFNPGTTLKFDIPASRTSMVQASLVVYNALGQQVKVLYKGQIAPGSYRLYWDGTNQNGKPLSSGIYYAVLKTDRFTKSVKMILMK